MSECGWPPERVTIPESPTDCRQIVQHLREAAQQTSGVLLFYFVGHGVLAPMNLELCLPLSDSNYDHPDITGIEYSRVKEAFRDSSAHVKVSILDCCYSGQAIDSLAGTNPADIAGARGVYTLTASDQAAHVPPLAEQANACTSFTGELINIIRTGIKDGPEFLTLGDIYRELRRQLAARGLPQPNQSGTDTVHQMVLTPNRWTDPKSPAAAEPSQHPSSSDGLRAIGTVPQWLRDFAVPPVALTVGQPYREMYRALGQEPVHQDLAPLLTGGINLAQLGSLLGLSGIRLRKLHRSKAFPRGTETWDVDWLLRLLGEAHPQLAPRIPVLWRSTTSEVPATFSATTFTDEYFVGQWSTHEGAVCVVYRCGGDRGQLADYSSITSGLPDAPDVIVYVTHEFGLYGPELIATDLAHPERRYEATWRDLHRLLRQDVPWWPGSLRRPAEMARWRPGTEPTTYEAADRTDLTPLLKLADSEQQDTPTRIAALHLIAQFRDAAIRSARADVEIGSERQSRWKGLIVPARPVTTGENAFDAIPEVVIRNGWAAIVDREDRAAFASTRLAVMFDSGEHLPFGHDFTISRANETASEWISRLVPATPTAGVVCLGTERVTQFLKDPLTGLPVVVRTGHPAFGDSETVQYVSVAPRRLATTSRLAELVLDDVVWVRTMDGVLYPAPRGHDVNLTFGYAGTGPITFAIAIDNLLDDITAGPADPFHATLSIGLLQGVTKQWGHGTTLSRNQLLLARQSNGVLTRPR